jgi:predicted secreted protein
MTQPLLLFRSVVLGFGLVACASTPEPSPAQQPAPSTPVESPPATPAPGAPIYDGNATQTIRARAGERFSIALPANITTPYKWIVANPNEAIAKLVSDEYKDAPPAGCQGCVGYAGTTTLTFEAVAAGAHPLQLAYRGLAQTDTPAQRELAIQLTVE